MVLDEVLQHNREFAARSGARALPGLPRRKVCVVTCMDSRLVEFLAAALGIGRGEADWVATAGNTITRHDNAVLRSVALSCILHGVKEVLVVGHTDCGAACDVMPLTEAMERAGITRSDVGPVDLREFFGLIPSPETNVRQVVDALASSPVVPPEVLIHGLLVDVRTGAIRLLVRGEARSARRHRAEGQPVPVFPGPAEPTPAGEEGIPGQAAEAPGVALYPPEPPADEETGEVEIRLGESRPAGEPPPSGAEGPAGAPPPAPTPTVTIDVGAGPTAGKPPSKRPPAARRVLPRRVTRARPARKAAKDGKAGQEDDLDIRLGPVRRRRPPRR